MALAARMAVLRSSGVRRTRVADPPRCRLDRNSPGAPWRFMAAITLSPKTRQRISMPPASLINSCTKIFASNPRKASITDLAACWVSASTTPMPWVPSSSLITRGAPPTISTSPSMSLVEWANPVTGRPMPRRAMICSDRSLSRDREMAMEVLAVKMPIISNWRTTAVP